MKNTNEINAETKNEYNQNLDRLLAEFAAKEKKEGVNTNYEPQTYVRPLTAEEKADKPDHEKRQRQKAEYDRYQESLCPRCGSPSCGNDCLVN